MFGFRSRQRASRGHSTSNAAQPRGSGQDSRWPDDVTEVGSILEKELLETSKKEEETAQGSGFKVKVGHELVSSKEFHPDFVDTGDHIVCCDHEPGKGNHSGHRTYFSVHYRTMKSAL